MVARLNNDSARFYAPYQRRAASSPGEEEGFFSPLLAAACAILRQRLSIVNERTWQLDGQPACFKTIVDAANRALKTAGGRYLCYPGLRSRYHQPGPAMTIRQSPLI
jgi:hypothetical protein